jgi:hypothetical protein
MAQQAVRLGPVAARFLLRRICKLAQSDRLVVTRISLAEESRPFQRISLSTTLSSMTNPQEAKNGNSGVELMKPPYGYRGG